MRRVRVCFSSLPQGRTVYFKDDSSTGDKSSLIGYSSTGDKIHLIELPQPSEKTFDSRLKLMIDPLPLAVAPKRCISAVSASIPLAADAILSATPTTPTSSGWLNKLLEEDAFWRLSVLGLTGIYASQFSAIKIIYQSSPIMDGSLFCAIRFSICGLIFLPFIVKAARNPDLFMRGFIVGATVCVGKVAWDCIYSPI